MKNKIKHQKKKLQSSTNNWPDPELTLSHVSNIAGWSFMILTAVT